MAWFECTTSASSGNGVALIVTTDASFAGTNITASNGEDTFTQQCPSSAPYVVTFEDIPTGTYTISGVTGGQTVSKTFVVSDYNFEFHNTPTGSTATPVNDIQTWLHCANIWDKTYTTINQVLADTSTLLALISSNNAADYMARSTNWASSVCVDAVAMGYIGNNNYCANKLLANSTWLNAICNSTYMESVLNVKVPTMTSNTVPSGVASMTNNRNDAYKVFDGTNANYDYGAAITGYIQYQFTSPMAIHCVKVNNSTETVRKSKVGNLQASTDGTNFVTLTNFGDRTDDFLSGVINSTMYSYYRLYFAPSTGYGNGFRSIQFYGRA